MSLFLKRNQLAIQVACGELAGFSDDVDLGSDIIHVAFC